MQRLATLHPSTYAAQQPLQLARCRAAVVSRKSLQTVAFRPAKPPTQTLVGQQDGATVLLPLDFYSCLGIARTAGSRAVRDALDKALLRRPEAYYSPDTVALRDLLLRGAAECLLNHDRRREYDSKAPGATGYVVSISVDHLPGALVLLQESGSNQLVLDLATQWLADNKQDARGRDVTAVMALAHHALAVQDLQREDSCVLDACMHLESALALLRQNIHSTEGALIAADLQRDVLQLLKEYSPDYCLALLALPMDEPQRQRGHALLRKLLYELPDDLSPLGPDKEDFMVAARPLMSEQEHLDLYSAAPSTCSSVLQQQMLAEAKVAVAFLQRRPLLLLQADSAFRHLEQQATRQEGGGPELCVEHACIALLLGNTCQALAHLGLSPGREQEASSPTQQAARDYVLGHCADSTDLLPGVYALAQCWMQQGILGSFRRSAAAVQPDFEQQQAAGQLDLAPWYDSIRVRLIILVLVLFNKARQCMRAVAGAPAAIWASLAWLFQHSQANGQAQQPLMSGGTSTSTSSTTSSSSTSRRVKRSGVDGTTSRVLTTGAATAGTSPPMDDASRRRNSQLPKSSSSSGAGSASQLQAATQADTKQAAAVLPVTTRQSRTVQPDQQRQQGTMQRAAGQQLPQPHASMKSSTQATEQQQDASRHGVQQPVSRQHQQQQRRQKAFLLTGQDTSATTDAAPGPSDAAAVGGPEACEAPSLVARARAAAGSGPRSHSPEHSCMDDEPGPEPSPAMRKQLSRQMLSLEVQMWDVEPDPPAWRAGAIKALSMIALGAMLVAAASTSKQQTASLPQGMSTLLIDARG